MNSNLLRLQLVHVADGTPVTKVSRYVPSRESALGLTYPAKVELFSESSLTKAGQPDARIRGDLLIASSENSEGDVSYRGNYGLYKQDREEQAKLLRARIAYLQSQINASKAELNSLYSGDHAEVASLFASHFSK